MPSDRITAERLTLRHFRQDDLEALHRIWSDPLTIWWGAHTRLDQTTSLLGRAIGEGWRAVEHDDQIIGDVYLRPSEHDTDALELGYHFLPSSWGHGFATEACAALLSTVPGQRVQAPIVPGNQRSRRVATKLGMVIIGQVQRGSYQHDLWEMTVS